MSAPLSKEHRRLITAILDGNTRLAQMWRDEADPVYEAITALVGAEQFWREGLKNIDPTADAGPSAGMCLQCVVCLGTDTETSIVSGDGKIVHKADCL